MEFFQNNPIERHQNFNRRRNRWRREGQRSISSDEASGTRKASTIESAWLVPGALRVLSVFVLYEVMEVHALLDSPAKVSLGIFATSFLLDSLVSLTSVLSSSQSSFYLLPWSFSLSSQSQGKSFNVPNDDESKMTSMLIARTFFHAVLSYLSLRLWCQGLIALSPPLAIAVDALSNALIACLICTSIRMEAAMAGLLRTILPSAVLLMSLGFISSAQVPAPLPCTFTTLASCAVDASSRLLLTRLSPSVPLHQRLSRLSVLFAAIFAAVAAAAETEMRIRGGDTNGSAVSFRREDAFITDIHELERDGINEELSHKPVIAFVQLSLSTQMTASIVFVSVFGSHLSRSGSSSGSSSGSNNGNSDDKPNSWADQGFSVAAGWRAMATSTAATLSLWMLQRNVDSAYLATASTSNSVDIPLLQGFLYPYLPLSKVITVVTVAHVGAWWGHRCADTALQRRSTAETEKERADDKIKSFSEAMKVATVAVKGSAIVGNFVVSMLTNSHAHAVRACLLIHECCDSGVRGVWIPVAWNQRCRDIFIFFRAVVSAVLTGQLIICCLHRLVDPPFIQRPAIMLPMSSISLLADVFQYIAATSLSPKTPKDSASHHSTSSPLPTRKANDKSTDRRLSTSSDRTALISHKRILEWVQIVSSICLCISSTIVLSYPMMGASVDLCTTVLFAIFLTWLTSNDLRASTPVILLSHRRNEIDLTMNSSNLPGGNASWFSWPHDQDKSYGHFHYVAEEEHRLPDDIQEALRCSPVDFAVEVEVSQQPPAK